MSNFVMLLVEDDALQRQALSEVFRDESFEVVECATAEAAELIVSSAGPNLRALVTDNNLAGRMTGIELAAYARGRHPRLQIIVIAGELLEDLPPRTAFLHKPFLPSELLDAVRS